MLEDLGRVGHLRQRLGAHEGTDLHALEAAGRQLLDKLDLGFGRDERFDSLEAIARGNFKDFDALHVLIVFGELTSSINSANRALAPPQSVTDLLAIEHTTRGFKPARPVGARPPQANWDHSAHDDRSPTQSCELLWSSLSAPLRCCRDGSPGSCSRRSGANRRGKEKERSGRSKGRRRRARHLPRQRRRNPKCSSSARRPRRLQLSRHHLHRRLRGLFHRHHRSRTRPATQKKGPGTPQSRNFSKQPPLKSDKLEASVSHRVKPGGRNPRSRRMACAVHRATKVCPLPQNQSEPQPRTVPPQGPQQGVAPPQGRPHRSKELPRRPPSPPGTTAASGQTHGARRRRARSPSASRTCAEDRTERVEDGGSAA